MGPMPRRGGCSASASRAAARRGGLAITWHVDSTQLSRRRASRADRIVAPALWLRLRGGWIGAARSSGRPDVTLEPPKRQHARPRWCRCRGPGEMAVAASEARVIRVA
jgi:hypothetical protein